MSDTTSKPNDGGPAFPLGANEYAGHGPVWGLSLRDYFAAKAMAGMLAYPGDETRGSHHNNNTPDGVAELAYRIADSMLKARG